MSETTTAVAVFCASGPVPQPYLDLASDVGTALAEAGLTLVSGGGNVSMMGAVARAARAAGGHTVGVIPRALVEREVADTDADVLKVVDTMRQRKQIMDDTADAFLILPGGVGTLEEFFEAWTAEYIGMHTKPVVLLDFEGFYAPLLDWLSDLRERGFVSARAFATLRRVTTVPEALAACARA
ncbi:TIGR00730 family Rossman fold protein [Tsukamurella sp. 8F]|uniref:LOG family protein n=1 Tax=unclassified Tsukamurella TaxID=2633480 RepID=UPI0023B893FA|nr:MULTISPECIES: TIGR00730 family Rossman fold protein [unclassified Tsukamurella]MDF0530046.1 TIGR00730 family Rossman fold protein [Tsukamurella sp. 8J]MDF0589550.1 TIGR00730 family Rossman fold protein [Tsukamurella sp. 8F]